jgi:hypothetical protein
MRFGPEAITITKDGVEAIAVASTAVVTTDPLSLGFGHNFALILTAAGTGPDIKVELVQSETEDGTYVVPKGNTFIGDSSNSKYVDVQNSTKVIYQIFPSCVKWLKLQLTGQGSNGANVTISAKLSKLEEL